MKKQPLVSIIIPTHNRAYLLSRAINSVINQTYQYWELIIIADACTDDTSDLIKSYLRDNRIKVISLNNGVGGAEARNIGMDESNGDLIAFLDDDDEWLKNKLDKQVKIFSEKNISIVGCQYRVNLQYGQEDRLDGGLVNLNKLLYINILGNFSTCMTKREHIDNLEISPELKSCQDWDLWIKILVKTKLDAYVINEILVIKDNAHNKPRITTDYLQANNSYLDFINKTEHLLNASQKSFRMSNYYSRQSRQLSNFKLYLKSLYYLFKSFHKVNIYYTISILFPYFLFGEGLKNWLKTTLFQKHS